jgi:hypothetical protein
MIAVSSIVSLQLDTKTNLLYGKLEDNIYMSFPEGYSNDNKFLSLSRSLTQLPKEWDSPLTAYLWEHVLDTSNFDTYKLLHKSHWF